MFISGHSIPHISLGGFILIFGFMAFNAGSQGTMSQKGDGEAIAAACLSTLVSIKWGHSITTWTRFMGGGGQKMSAFVHAQGIKTVHEGRGRGSKNDEILSTQLLNAPKSKIQIKKIVPDFHLNLF